MKLISIEKQHSGEAGNPSDSVMVNADNICSLFMDKGVVVVRMNCGWGLYSKFTSLNSAADYLQRAVDPVTEDNGE
tara:strand:+ start:173 stop:400 length:228 start_codon:yes stop_codon:yes gene_type:complete